MPLTIIEGDIVKMEVDIVVNAANTALQEGGGVCGAIFEAAGRQDLQKACQKAAPIKFGQAIITSAFNMSCKYIVHAAGPVYKGSEYGEEALLRSCYRNSLALALEKECKSIAFPLISSGIFNYPKEDALSIARDEIKLFLMKEDLDIYLVIFDKKTFEPRARLLNDIEKFVLENLVDASIIMTSAVGIFKIANLIPEVICEQKDELSFGDLDESFYASLLRIIEKKGLDESQVYKKANIDRRLFSKIRNEKYSPGKKTALALAIALELNLPQTKKLIEKLGFSLSRSLRFDVIVEYFIVNGKYDVLEINETLFKFDQPLLGGK